MDEALDLVDTRHVAQHVRAVAVRSHERVGVADRVVDVGFRGKVHYGSMTVHRGDDSVTIAYVAMHERTPTVIDQVTNVVPVTGVCQRVVDGDLVI